VPLAQARRRAFRVEGGRHDGDDHRTREHPVEAIDDLAEDICTLLQRPAMADPEGKPSQQLRTLCHAERILPLTQPLP